jgi:hypothetical protein
MLVIPALGKLRQEYCEFKALLATWTDLSQKQTAKNVL